MKTKRRDQLSAMRRLTEKELSGKIFESEKALVIKQQEKLLGKLKNTSSLRFLRQEISRMKTVLDEKVTERLSNTNE